MSSLYRYVTNIHKATDSPSSLMDIVNQFNTSNTLQINCWVIKLTYFSFFFLRFQLFSFKGFLSLTFFSRDRVDFNTAIVWMVSILPLILCSPCLFSPPASTLSSILADFNIAMIWMVSILPLIFCSPSLFSSPRTLLSTLADFNSSIVWMGSVLFLI